jgi:hypothetical protein
MRIDDFTIRACRAMAAMLLAALAGCGGNGITELFVKLITARFVPATVTLSPGASTSVELEVTCDNDALNTPFGRLGLLYKLDPSVAVPAGVSATLPGLADIEGFRLVPCNAATGDPNLRLAHIPVVIAVAVGTPPQSAVLRVFVEVEEETACPARTAPSPT